MRLVRAFSSTRSAPTADSREDSRVVHAGPRGGKTVWRALRRARPVGQRACPPEQAGHDFLFTSESLVPCSQLRRTEFYNDFSRYYDIAGNVGFGVATEPGIATTVTLRGILP